MKSKKGAVFIYILVPLFMAAVINYYILTLSTSPFQLQSFIGAKQSQFLITSQNFEKEIIYLEQSGKIAADQSFIVLAEQGGFILNSPCGKISNINLWNTKDRTCFPDYENNFKAFLLRNFKRQRSDVGYVFSLIGEDIIFNADKDIVYDVVYNQKKIGFYQPRHSFMINREYDLKEYLTLRFEAEELLEKCKGKDDISSCVKEKKQLSWKLGSCEGVVINSDKKMNFCVSTNIVFPFALDEEGNNKKLEYSFALDFSAS